MSENHGFHQLIGKSNRRMVYKKSDFFDYSIMLALCVVICGLVYGWGSFLSLSVDVLCAFMLISFVVRNGFAFKIPLIVRKPQDIFLIFYYKLKNIKPIFIVALCVLLLENLMIYLTPTFPHMIDLTREVAIWLFFIHLGGISLYRTVIFVDHIRKREKVQAFLLESQWKHKVKTKFSLNFEIFHAYFTGILTHIVLLVPWYFVITTFYFSVLLLPIVCWINFVVAGRFLAILNSWYYREHWLGHNHEFDFVSLHGPHHDAIPSGMIAVAGNGFLEGASRFTFGIPNALYNPLMAFGSFSLEVLTDIIGSSVVYHNQPYLAYEGQYKTISLFPSSP